MNTGIGPHLQALGRTTVPRQIEIRGDCFSFRKIFKHDFFALTALYESACSSDNSNTPAQVVLKLARQGDFLGLPLAWLGRVLCRHEMAILKSLQGIEGVPRLIGSYYDTGMLYEYIKGCSLDEKPQLPDDFFDRLEALLRQIHAHHIAYIDMNKRGNILLGTDNQPYMIDFQISQQINWPFWPLRSLGDFILKILQKEDFYHLAKHKRRLAPHLMPQEQLDRSRRVSPWIDFHRRIARPLTKLRRRILYYLYRKGHLPDNQIDNPNPESNPNRWKK